MENADFELDQDFVRKNRRTLEDHITASHEVSGDAVGSLREKSSDYDRWFSENGYIYTGK